jgi:methyl-accepting chemotaxis protein
MTEKLNGLVHGTGAFARAMNQVAASNEDQSKKINEVAEAANALNDTSKRISQLVATFKVGDN